MQGDFTQQSNHSQLQSSDSPQAQNQIKNEYILQEQQQPQYMYHYYFDKNTQQVQWAKYMFPIYYNYFKNLQKMLQELSQTVNKKWNAEQYNKYQLFLTDLNNYIRDHIWGRNIYDFNMFLQAMRQYSQYINPLGYELYTTQMQYLYKKSIGYDFKLDKKKKGSSTNTIKLQQQKPIIRQTEKKVQIQRINDPIIDIKQLEANQWSPEKYPNLAFFKKQNANLVLIGHVDSGKSTLTGNILKQLNQVDQQEWLRNKQEAKQNHMESWQLAGIADVDPNQRKRGKTIQYAKLMFSYKNRRFTLFDAPGHKNYVPNMIMGACQADIAILIISAKEGEFQSGFVKDGQTQQHALLAKSLGVKSLIVAVTKMNTVNWLQARFKMIKQKVQPFLVKICGFQNPEFIPIDSISNINIHKPIQNSWWKGDCFLEFLLKVKLPQRNVSGPLRIPLIDKFKDVGNFFLYGKIQSGAIIQQQTVTMLPQRKTCVIKQIYNAKDERMPYAIAGQNLKLKIKGLDQSEIKRGDMICNNQNYCQQTKQFKAKITVIQLPQPKKLLSSGYECVLHMHAISEEIQISKVQTKFTNQNKKQIPATFLVPGQSGIVVIKSANPICLQKFQFMPNLGRFTVRDEGKTIGYGQVLKIKPAKSLLKQQKEQLLVQTQKNKKNQQQNVEVKSKKTKGSENLQTQQ